MDPDPALFDACERDSGPHKVVHELLRTQIETNTRVCTSVADLRAAQIETRSLVIDTAARYLVRRGRESLVVLLVGHVQLLKWLGIL